MGDLTNGLVRIEPYDGPSPRYEMRIVENLPDRVVVEIGRVRIELAKFAAPKFSRR